MGLLVAKTAHAPPMPGPSTDGLDKGRPAPATFQGKGNFRYESPQFSRGSKKIMNIVFAKCP